MEGVTVEDKDRAPRLEDGPAASGDAAAASVAPATTPTQHSTRTETTPSSASAAPQEAPAIGEAETPAADQSAEDQSDSDNAEESDEEYPALRAYLRKMIDEGRCESLEDPSRPDNDPKSEKRSLWKQGSQKRVAAK